MAKKWHQRLFAGRAMGGGFFYNIAMMFAGSVTAQAVGLLAAPVITRLYLPEAFGVMALIQSISGIAGIVACFCYQQAIVLPESDEHAYSLTILSLLAVFVTVGLVGVGLAFTGNLIAGSGRVAEYKAYLYFVPVLVMFLGLKQVCVYLYTRFKLFKALSIGIAIIPLFTASIKIVAGYLFGSSPVWLIGGNLFGLAVAVIYFTVRLRSRLIYMVRHIHISAIRKVAQEYSNFPKYSLPGTFFDALANSFPFILFAAFYSPASVGFFGFTRMILKRPVAVISQSVSNIVYQKVSEVIHRDQDLLGVLKKTTLGLVCVGILPFGLLMCTGEWVFCLLFGENWAEAGIYAQVLSPLFFFMLINKPSGRVIIAKQRLKFRMYYSFVNNCLRVVAIAAGYYLFESALSSITLLSVTGVGMNIIFIGYAFVISMKREPDWSSAAIKEDRSGGL